MLGQDSHNEYLRTNRWVLWLFGCLLVLLLFRLSVLQILKGDAFFHYSTKNQIRQEYVPALRGMLYDRHGHVLVDYRFRFDVVVVPQYLKQPEKVLKLLSTLLNQPMSTLKSDYLKKKKGKPRFQAIPIARDVSQEVVAQIEVQKKFYDGLDIQMTPMRHYPYGAVFSHVLGYVSEPTTADFRKSKNHLMIQGEELGRDGLERVADEQLRGTHGVQYIRVDAHGRRIEHADGSFMNWVRPVAATPGHTLHTTLDVDVQKTLYEGLKKHRGAGVVLEIHTGRVLGMVSTPNYNPNTLGMNWHTLSRKADYPLFNRVVQGVYPPGSTFKVFSALAALQEKIITPEHTITCKGSYQLGRKKFHCWKEGGHGKVDFEKAVLASCDVYFYHFSKVMAMDRLAMLARQFGMGRMLGIELLNENRGLIPDTKWKKKTYGERWQTGETLNVAIGQGYVSTTPLQLASAYATLLNGGTVFRPYLIEQERDVDGKLIRANGPKVIRRVQLDPGHIGLIVRGMIKAIETSDGTGFSYRDASLKIGGKTGTAQVRAFSPEDLYSSCESLPPKERHHGIFAGFWPTKHPKYITIVVKEHGCSGSSAIPIAQAVFRTLKKQKQVAKAEGN